MFIFCVLLFSKLLREQFTLMDFEVVDLKLEVSSSSGNGNGGGGGGSSPEKSGEENSGEHKKQVRLVAESLQRRHLDYSMAEQSVQCAVCILRSYHGTDRLTTALTSSDYRCACVQARASISQWKFSDQAYNPRQVFITSLQVVSAVAPVPST
jgi:hypothetical protein